MTDEPNIRDDTRADAYAIWSGKQTEEPIPIWLDCDTGHDDAFAILLSAQCPRLHLLGISTVHGNASLDNVTRNTLSVLEAIGRPDIPVYAGAAKPFCRQAVHAAEIHGESGLGGVTLLPAPSTSARTDCTAVEAAYQALMRTPPQTAWLIATGALTNIALLFAVHPDLVGHLRGLSIMGGAVGGFFTHAPMGRMRERLQLSRELSTSFTGALPDFTGMPVEEVAQRLRELGVIGKREGEEDDERVHMLIDQARQRFGNWTPYAEFNIYCDPEAAHSLLTNPTLAAKTTLIPLDLTHQVTATAAVSELLRLNTSNTSLIRRLFGEVIAFFAQTYWLEFGMRDGPPLHDPVAVAAALAPELFHDNGGERFEVFVVTEGDRGGMFDERRGTERIGQCGRTVVRLMERGSEGVRISRTLELEKFWLLVDLALGRAEGVVGV